MNLSILLSLTLAATSASPSAAPLELQPVVPGVWAALQPRAGRFNDSNSVVIVTDRDVVVVDSQADPAATAALIAALPQISSLPVRYLVNTHWHGDHTQSNALYEKAFGPGLAIVGHRSLALDVPNRAAPALAEEAQALEAAIVAAEAQLAAGKKDDGTTFTSAEATDLAGRIARSRTRLEAQRGVVWAPPDLTYERHLRFERGTGTLELLHFRAHTRGDTVLYLPQSRTLITGDLLDDLPYGGHGYPGEWLAALNHLDSLDWQTLIPGHGQIRHGEAARKHLDLVRRWIGAVVAHARAANAAGKTLEEAQKTLALPALRQELAGEDAAAQRAFDAWQPELLARAWAEARGELVD